MQKNIPVSPEKKPTKSARTTAVKPDVWHESEAFRKNPEKYIVYHNEQAALLDNYIVGDNGYRLKQAMMRLSELLLIAYNEKNIREALAIIKAIADLTGIKNRFEDIEEVYEIKAEFTGESQQYNLSFALPPESGEKTIET